jgi:hypothetical protein
MDPDEVSKIGKEALVQKMKKFAFMFKALEQGAGVWDDTKWYENLMQNVKLTTEEITDEKNETSSDTKIRRDKKKRAV